MRKIPHAIAIFKRHFNFKHYNESLNKNLINPSSIRSLVLNDDIYFPDLNGDIYLDP